MLTIIKFFFFIHYNWIINISAQKDGNFILTFFSGFMIHFFIERLSEEDPVFDQHFFTYILAAQNDSCSCYGY